MIQIEKSNETHRQKDMTKSINLLNKALFKQNEERERERETERERNT